MRTYFLFANPGKPETIPVARSFAKECIARDCTVFLDDWLHDLLGIGEPLKIEELNASIDVVVSFGGDGTLLRVLPSAAKNCVPVLGVNLGHTGFLLEIEPEELPFALDEMISQRYKVYSRSMLSCRFSGLEPQLVMNEVALTRGQSPASLIVDVWYNDELVYTIHGDGVLVSTPTGTTGYSLSAGGPIVSPSVSCQVVSPICSHIMHQRPVVLPPEGTVRLVVRNNRGMKYQLSLDGQTVYELETAQKITVTPAKEPARFIYFKPQRFLERLHIKQMEWSNHIYGGDPNEKHETSSNTEPD